MAIVVKCNCSVHCCNCSLSLYNTTQLPSLPISSIFCLHYYYKRQEDLVTRLAGTRLKTDQWLVLYFACIGDEGTCEQVEEGRKRTF